MVFKEIFFISVILIGGLVSACETPKTNSSANNSAAKPAAPATSPAAAVPSQPPTDDAARITLADAKKAFDNGTALFIDTRADTTYKQEHITGSINIPNGTLDANINKLPKGKKLIAYCS